MLEQNILNEVKGLTTDNISRFTRNAIIAAIKITRLTLSVTGVFLSEVKWMRRIPRDSAGSSLEGRSRGGLRGGL